MRRSELEHVIRAAAAITNEYEIMVWSELRRTEFVFSASESKGDSVGSDPHSGKWSHRRSGW